ncbi:glycosyltransferase involved in cell wall biosynthesis [Desulfitobacterium sp. LBE]|uniref:Glycosyl transferase group 1 n=1 Tax=Desulfitobacterium hafniense TaxID=49338 RepID=A0A098B8R9_DESHA|nr:MULTISPECIES: glycosyltransferase [Desulfitobacterium]TWH58258.1 glycosyltransferase involved in cell wall biosynthesis [Desulfitobacterium sp. LBE]CDX04755.1 Glycosyl transferase group 1 [Desulfitobacterium hafniense]
MPTIIYPRTLPWSWMVQRPQQLMRELSYLGYTIFYEDRGAFPQPQVKKLWDSFYLCQGISPMTLAHPRPRILWLTFPQHLYLIDTYRPDAVVFDCSDEAKEEFAAWGPYIKPLLAQTKLVFASSQSLYDQLAPQHPEVTLLRNGVDFAHFCTPQKRPLDLPTGQPIIGYSGAIAPWLDWDLLKRVIEQHPNFHFVFLGALVMLKGFPLESPNVSYLGLKSYDSLPGYLHGFNVSLIPFKLTPMTMGCNPIKLYEYAAAGLPTVATPLPELIGAQKVIQSLSTGDSEQRREDCCPGLNLAATAEDFSQSIREVLLKSVDQEALQAFALQNTWQKRAVEIHNKILKQGLYTG